MLNKLAQGLTNPILPENLRTKDSETFFTQLFPSLVGLIFVIGSLAFFFMILFGAIQWILSGGDKGAVEAARGRITNALIGIVVLFGSFAIINLIEIFFGLNILTIDIGPLKIR